MLEKARNTILVAATTASSEFRQLEKNFLQKRGEKAQRAELENLGLVTETVNALEPEYSQLSDEALQAKTEEFRTRLREKKDTLETLLPEAFAAVREATKRTIGLRHHDVQLIGGTVLHRGDIAEMRTGEGKTLVATLPAYLNALESKGVHVITVNDYLARRDARAMAPIFQSLGMSIGVLQNEKTNSANAFLVDSQVATEQEQNNHLRQAKRKEAYDADITYGSNSEFGFDYLRDNMAQKASDRVQRGHHYAIVDEVDNVLIDEARTPLILSREGVSEAEWYEKMSQAVSTLSPLDYVIDEKDRTVTLTETGYAQIERQLGETIINPLEPEKITPHQAKLSGYLEQTLLAHHLYHRNHNYLVQNGEVVLVDEFTGRLMPGRRMADGLHEALEAKEKVKVKAAGLTMASVTTQNYFRMYEKLSGMTATGMTDSEEFNKVYNLDVVAIPSNLEYQSLGENSPLVAIKERDSQGNIHTYYAKRNDPERKAIAYERVDEPDLIYKTKEAQIRALTLDIVNCHLVGRPILAGTTSIEDSELLGTRLGKEQLQALLSLQIIRELWIQTHHLRDRTQAIPQLAWMNEPLEKVIASGRIAEALTELGRPTDLTYGQNLFDLHNLLQTGSDSGHSFMLILENGIPHSVLNAGNAAIEGKIIAGAGAFGAVTIATNMAGRGVDIKLGGELTDEIQVTVTSSLDKLGYPDVYNLDPSERSRLLHQNEEELRQELGERFSLIEDYYQYVEQREKVVELQGLRVASMSRNEARRIDNQLKGRAARQGDPGTSRFYLSLEDDLLKQVGGNIARAIQELTNRDDTFRIESRLATKLIDDAQLRLEGVNFDTRKYLLEYDDVVATFRQGEAFTHNFLLETPTPSREVDLKISKELREQLLDVKPDELPVEFVEWSESLKADTRIGEAINPSYGMSLLIDQVRSQAKAGGSLPAALHDLVDQSLNLNDQYLNDKINRLVAKTGHEYEQQSHKAEQTIGKYITEAKEKNRNPSKTQILEFLQSELGITVNGKALDDLGDTPEAIQANLIGIVRSNIRLRNFNLVIQRIIQAFPNAFSEPTTFSTHNWEEISSQINTFLSQLHQRRRQSLFGRKGSVAHIISNSETKWEELSDGQLSQLIRSMALPSDKKAVNPITQPVFSYKYRMAEIVKTQGTSNTQQQAYRYYISSLDTLSESMGQQVLEQALKQAKTLRDLGPRSINVFREDELDQPITVITEEQRSKLIAFYGFDAFETACRTNQINSMLYLWPTFLNAAEALRISVQAEAYGQREPLTQFKLRIPQIYDGFTDDVSLMSAHAALNLTTAPKPEFLNAPASATPSSST